MPKAIHILAPMDDVTDTVFRRIVADCAASSASDLSEVQGSSEARNKTYKRYDDVSTGADNEAIPQKHQRVAGSASKQVDEVSSRGLDFTMTEFVNVDGLCSPGRDRIIHKLSTQQDKTPVIAQIWGKIPENFERIAREISDGTIPGFSGVDLNFGCPEKNVIKNECCSAMQKPELRDKAVEIIEATQKGAGKLPVSIKTRLGFGEIDYTWHELLLKQNPSMLTVHVRTTKQMSKVPAQWDAILPIVELRDKISPNTKIILNGDIMNRKQGEELAKKYKVDGVMIGRGVFQDPYCFAADSPWSKKGKDERVELLKKHINLYLETYPEGQRKYNPLKKFAKIYISDFPGASELRDKIMHTSEPQEALELLAASD